MKQNGSSNSGGWFGVRPSVWWFGLLVVLCILGAVFFSANRRENRSALQTASVDEDSAKLEMPTIVEPVSKPSVLEAIHSEKSLNGWIDDLKGGDEKARVAAQLKLIAMGSPAVPALADALNDPRSLNRAAFALGAIGKDSLPVLLEALTNGPMAISREIAGAGVMQSSPLLPFEGEIVPSLVVCMSHTNSTVRLGAVNALQSYWKHPDLVMEALIKCLSDPDANVRASASTVIEKFGRNAGSAIPILVSLAKEDQDSLTRTRAAESLRAIAPLRAKEEGL